MDSLSEKIKSAQTVSDETLWKLLREHRTEILSNAVFNRNLTEEMAIFIAKNKAVSSETLGFLASDVRFKDSYSLKLAISKNPKSPLRVTLSLLKFLRIFDLSALTRDQRLPLPLRQKVEQVLIEKIPTLPSGVRIALAKRANSTLVVTLMEKGGKEVICSCLDSPSLIEGDLHKLINKPTTPPLVIRLIAEHPKWSLRYAIRHALIRNFHTPMSLVEKFISSIKTPDLKYLYQEPRIPSSTKPFIFTELMQRGETVEPPSEKVYELEEEDI